MQTKFTTKSVKESYPTIIKIGYGKLQEVLSYLDRDGYCSGVYGWKCDIFRITPDVAISTGYDPFGNTTIDTETCNEIIENFDKQIECLKSGYNWDMYRNIALSVIREVLYIKGVI